MSEANPVPEILDHVRIVLVGPMYGGNIGSTCRAMANMGLRDIVLADPRDYDRQEARMMACNANDILESIRVVPTLADALSDCGRVFGTTARRGLYRSHALTPNEAAPQILAAAGEGRTAAIVFGREDKGLSNDEVALCTDVMQIPTTEVYSSLNLSQAVMVIAYELFRATDAFVPMEEKSPDASSATRERMFEIWRETLLEIGFMKDDKADHMMMGLRRILARGKFTDDDASIMMGIARQMEWAAGKGKDA